MSHSLVDVDNRIDEVNLNLNTRIDNTSNNIKNIITKDDYNLYRVTGITDWHLRLEYYAVPETDTNDMIDIYLTTNSLISFIDKQYSHVRYIHLLSSDMSGDGTINFDNLVFSDIGDNSAIDMSQSYIIKISANILCKRNLNIRTESDSLYYTFAYNYFVNLKFVDTSTNLGLTSSQKIYDLDIGWNRIDWMVVYNPSDTTTRIFKINFNPVLDGVNIKWIDNNDEVQQSTNLFKNSIELVTGLFPDSTKLFPQLNKEANVFTITSANDNLDYILTTDHNVTCNISLNNHYTIVFSNQQDTSNLHTVIQGYNSSEYEYYIDSIEIINMSNINMDYDGLSISSNGTPLVLPEVFQYSQSIDDNSSYIYSSVFTKIEDNIAGTYLGYTLEGITGIHPHELRVNIVSRTTTLVNGSLLKIGINNPNEDNINKITFEPNGSLGIGSENTHGYSLYVNNIGTTNKGIYCADDITVLSSRKYKKDIRTIENPFEKISKLQGVMYKRSDKEGEEAEKEHMGLILEDVREVIPEVCDDNGIKYGELVALLIEGMKSMKS